MGVDSDELGLMDDDDDAPTVLEICPESEGRVTFWIRRASMRSVTYWVTWNRISNPTTKNDQIYAVSGLGRRKKRFKKLFDLTENECVWEHGR